MNGACLQLDRDDGLALAKPISPLERDVGRLRRILTERHKHGNRFRYAALDSVAPVAARPKLPLVPPQIDSRLGELDTSEFGKVVVLCRVADEDGGHCASR